MKDLLFSSKKKGGLCLHAHIVVLSTQYGSWRDGIRAPGNVGDKIISGDFITKCNKMCTPFDSESNSHTKNNHTRILK